MYDLWLSLARRPSWSFVIDISWSYQFKNNLCKRSKMCCLSYLSYFCLCFVCLYCLAKKMTHKISQHHWTAGSLSWCLCFPIDYKNLSSFKSVSSEMSFCSFLPSEVSYASDRHSLSVCVKMMFLVIWEICSGKFRGGGVGRDELGG